MAALKTIFRRTRTLLWTAFSIVIVLAAVVMGIGELLMPYSDRYQPRLEAWLSDEFGRPVRLDSFGGEWTAFGPRLTLRGMKLGPAQPAGQPGQDAEVAIESAALDVKPLNLLLPGRPLYNFRVIGARFELTRAADGRFTLSGFGVTRRGGEAQGSALKELARVGEVILEDSWLEYRDDGDRIHLAFGDIDGRLQLDENELFGEFQASLYDDGDDRVFGDVEATVQLSLDGNGRPRDAQWRARARELRLAALQDRLPANPFLPQLGWLNAELWGEWSQEGGHRLRGFSDLREARLVNEYQDLSLERLTARFRWDGRSGKDWSLHFADLLYDDGRQSWTAPRISLARDTAADLGLWISADRLPLGVPLRLTRDIMSMYRTPWPRALPGSAEGQVRELDLVLDASWQLRLARGEVTGARVADWERGPTLEGLDASVALGRGSGRIDVQGDAVVLDWPRMFRDPLPVRLPPCRVTVDWGEGWQVGVSGCSIGNDDLEGYGDAIIRSNTGRPAIDLNVAVRRGRVGQLDPYWPEAVLKEPVKAWLRRGLLGGDITAGRVQLRGDLDDFPFRGGEGRFEAVAEVSGGRLDFQEGWPEAQSLEVTARFVDAGMDIQARSGEIGGVTAREARAVIADFKTPVLTLDYAADSDLPGLLGFLRRTPLAEHVGANLDRFEFAGPATTAGRLEIPFGAEGGLSLDGQVDVRAARFADPALAITVDDISGRLDYDETGVRARNLQAAYEGKPAQVGLVVDTGAAEVFRAELAGEFTVAEVAPAFLEDGFGLLERSSGQALWRVTVAADRAVAGEAVPVLRLETDLRGIAIDLPPPLAKPADAAWPFRLRFPLTGAERVLECSVDDRLAMAFDLPEDAESPRSAAFRLGARQAALPGPGLLRVAGRARHLDLDGWLDIVIDAAVSGRGLGGLALEPARLQARHLVFLDREFDEVGMEFSAEDAEIRGVFEGEDIDGKVRFTAGAGGMNSLSAE
ncbi:MAG: DUF3971 domain-containing protein, partial [Xanthomonadales bacterium]|nr:DUF3971 domain-containing protein [Xanthomonadales bacterium]